MSSSRRLLLLALVLLVACVVAGDQQKVATLTTAATATTEGPDSIVNRLLVDYVSDSGEVLSYGSAPNSSYSLESTTADATEQRRRQLLGKGGGSYPPVPSEGAGLSLEQFAVQSVRKLRQTGCILQTQACLSQTHPVSDMLHRTAGAAAVDDWLAGRDTIDSARVKAAPKKQLTHQYYKALPVGRPGELGKCAVVGYGQNIKEGLQGPSIDSHDTVVRLGFIPLKEFKSHAGDKVDLVFLRSNDPEVDTYGHKRHRTEYGREAARWQKQYSGCAVASKAGYRCMTYNVDGPAIAQHVNYVRELYQRFTGSGSQFSKDMQACKPSHYCSSAGFNLVNILLASNLCESIDLYGFSRDGKSAYWSRRSGDHVQQAASKHFMNVEVSVWEALQNHYDEFKLRFHDPNAPTQGRKLMATTTEESISTSITPQTQTNTFSIGETEHESPMTESNDVVQSTLRIESPGSLNSTDSILSTRRHLLGIGQCENAKSKTSGRFCTDTETGEYVARFCNCPKVFPQGPALKPTPLEENNSKSVQTNLGMDQHKLNAFERCRVRSRAVDYGKSIPDSQLQKIFQAKPMQGVKQYQSCAFVGNAGALVWNRQLSESFAAAIDSHDAVIRLNKALVLGDITKYVGKRETVRYINGSGSKVMLQGCLKAAEDCGNPSYGMSPPLRRDLDVLIARDKELGGATPQQINEIKSRSGGATISKWTRAQWKECTSVYEGIRKYANSKCGMKFTGVSGCSAGLMAVRQMYPHCGSITLYGMGDIFADQHQYSYASSKQHAAATTHSFDAEAFILNQLHKSNIVQSCYVNQPASCGSQKGLGRRLLSSNTTNA